MYGFREFLRVAIIVIFGLAIWALIAWAAYTWVHQTFEMEEASGITANDATAL